MKKIDKHPQPNFLRDWFERERQQDLDVTYEGGFKAATIIENGEKKSLYVKVKESLLDEQGYLCCYTGKRINLDTSHIEHLKPQTKSKQNRAEGKEDYEDVKYKNLLAAFPKKLMETDPQTGQKKHIKCEFGAERRNDKELPITPLDEKCEQWFLFTPFGEIKGLNDAAKETIKILNLDCPRLQDERSSVIDEILQNTSISQAAVERALENAFERTVGRMFKPYCFVLKLACELRLKKFEKDANRNKFAQQQKKK